MGLQARAVGPEGGLTARKAKVIWYDQVKGFGFLAVEGYPHDLFLHNSEVRASGIPVSELDKGVSVICAVGSDKTGRPCAVNLKKAD